MLLFPKLRDGKCSFLQGASQREHVTHRHVLMLSPCYSTPYLWPQITFTCISSRVHLHHLEAVVYLTLHATTLRRCLSLKSIHDNITCKISWRIIILIISTYLVPHFTHYFNFIFKFYFRSVVFLFGCLYCTVFCFHVIINIVCARARMHTGMFISSLGLNVLFFFFFPLKSFPIYSQLFQTWNNQKVLINV